MIGGKPWRVGPVVVQVWRNIVWHGDRLSDWHTVWLLSADGGSNRLNPVWVKLSVGPVSFYMGLQRRLK